MFLNFFSIKKAKQALSQANDSAGSISVVSAQAAANAAAITDLTATVDALPTHTISSSDPEGAVTAIPASTHFNTSTEVTWTKKTGTGNTGWVPPVIPV